MGGELHPQAQRALSYTSNVNQEAAEKPVLQDRSIEVTRVKLRDPVRCIPPTSTSSLWSADGLKRVPWQQQQSDERSTENESDNNATPREDEAESETKERGGNQTDELEDNDCAALSKCSPTNAVTSQDLRDLWAAEPEVLQLDSEAPTEEPEVQSPREPVKMTSDQYVSKTSNFASSASAPDIWSSVKDGEQDAGVAVVSPHGSSDSGDPSVASEFGHSFDSARVRHSEPDYVAASAEFSHRMETSGRHSTPSFASMNQLQEDFPRTPSPVLESFQSDGWMSGTGLYNSLSVGETNSQGIECLQEDFEGLRFSGSAMHGHQPRLHEASSFEVPRQRFHFDEADYQKPAQARAQPPRSTGRSSYVHPPYSAAPPPAFHPRNVVPASGQPNASAAQWFAQAPGSGGYLAPQRYSDDMSGAVGFQSMQFGGRTPRGGYQRSFPPAPPVPRPSDVDFMPAREFGDPNTRPWQPSPSNSFSSWSPSSRRSEYTYVHPIAHSYNSGSLLEEFTAAPKTDKWELADIRGHLVVFARDQTGSRFIQQKLEKADETTRASVFNEIYPSALMLMMDLFGNYVIQKFLDHGSLKQQQMLVSLMKRNMIELALQMYGCRVIQKALECTHVSEQLTLIEELKGHVLKCITDQNGNHVLQKCIEAASVTNRLSMPEAFEMERRVTVDDVQFIIDDVIGQAAALSTHTYGCRVIQRILEHCDHNRIRPIMNEIVYNCQDLAKDQFGNYVVQHVIKYGEPDQRDIVINTIYPVFCQWSNHKYASNVVEASLDFGTKAEIHRVVDYLLESDEIGATCPLLPMMKHMYGNYVVQKLLDKSDEADAKRIRRIILHNADYLRRFTYGKHVLSHAEQRMRPSF